MSSFIRRTMFATSLTTCLLVGAGAGIATATVPRVLSPAGVSADIPSEQIPEPEWERNSSGETFGSLFSSNSPTNEPDLIQTLASNGRTGYVRKTDLDEADGTTAALAFESPEQALIWESSAGRSDKTIPVYNEDGLTVIGDFVVYGTDNTKNSESILDADEKFEKNFAPRP